jgi:hypothetical protein
MRRVVAALIVAVVLFQMNWVVDVSGQASCTFKLGFATLRELVGEQKIGACLEDEYFNLDNGNAEQHTTGGLMVWRKADNFTAFTDGGTSWINGPNGLQSRPNTERFAWERDPLTAPSANAPSTSVSQRSAGSPVASANSSTGTSSSIVADASPTAVSTPTKAPTATRAATATPAPTATSAATPTKTPNPVNLKFTEKPDDIDTGQDQHVELETNAEKATCAFTVTYHNSTAGSVGSSDVDDGKCELTWNLPDGTKTGEATLSVTVSGKNGSATTEEHFDVNKGDTFLTGDVSIDLDIDDFPDNAKVGDTVQISVKTNLKNRGTCSISINWPQVAATAGESKTPEDGKCSWSIPVPSTITKKGSATASITVQNRSGIARAVNRDFDVRLP